VYCMGPPGDKGAARRVNIAKRITRRGGNQNVREVGKALASSPILSARRRAPTAAKMRP
jgi:hypothetical protein